MLKLSSTWHIPDTELPDAIDRRYFDEHVPAVRGLPGLRRHVLLKGVPIGDGLAHGQMTDYLGDLAGRPRVWRGEDLWFDGRAALDAAAASPEWKSVAAAGFLSSVAGLQVDLFEIVEEYRVSDAPETGDVQPGRYIVDRGTWHIPDEQQPDAVDGHYFDVHVPNVRRQPSLHRHAVLKGVPWPADRHPRTWRGADCWKDARRLDEDLESADDDGYVAMLAGLEFDRFAVEAEWTPDRTPRGPRQ